MIHKHSKKIIVSKVSKIVTDLKYPIKDSITFSKNVDKEIIIGNDKIDISNLISKIPNEFFPLTSKDDVVKKFNFLYDNYLPPSGETVPSKRKKIGPSIPDKIKEQHYNNLHNILKPDETGLNRNIYGLWVFVRYAHNSNPSSVSTFPGRQFAPSSLYEGWYWVELPVKRNVLVKCCCCYGDCWSSDTKNIGNAMLDKEYYSGNKTIIFEIPPIMGPLDWV